ncbi:MAG: hypothetical protein GC164_01270 [Phycisphaera sp.]|nr:hypothetical protein [Phycisphaera sp.]
MPTRDQIVTASAQGLRDFAGKAAQTRVLVGFDGFVDSIIHVVDRRQDAERYDAVETIEAFGKKVLAAAGQSSNFELVTTLQKLGGNGPIMANALASVGLGVTYVGSLGEPAIHPVFEEFSRTATVFSVCDVAQTDALEFDDGKLMLGKHASLHSVKQETLDKIIGRDRYAQIVRDCALIGINNWTMLTGSESIWECLINEILPTNHVDRKLVFIDLADPAKRTREDLARVLGLCTKFNDVADTVLGLNLNESSQVANVMGIKLPEDPEPAIEETAGAMRAVLGLKGVVIHPRKGAAAVIKNNGVVTSASFKGPFVSKPKLSTGAGDNFNAGFCVGMLADLTVEGCLCSGVASSGYYVRNARSATLTELAEFVEKLPEPQD